LSPILSNHFLDQLDLGGPLLRADGQRRLRLLRRHVQTLDVQGAGGRNQPDRRLDGVVPSIRSTIYLSTRLFSP
jgi:hypothetical protein